MNLNQAFTKIPILLTERAVNNVHNCTGTFCTGKQTI